MCKILKVSRNGYYNWCAKEDKQEDPFLFESIKTIFQKSHKTYGTRRIKQGLLNLYGWIVSRTRIAKVMKENNLVAKRKGGFNPIWYKESSELLESFLPPLKFYC